MSSASTTERPRTLPAQFADLQQWDEWIVWDDPSRVQKHVSADVEDVVAFYNAVAPRAGEIYQYLSGVPLEGDMADEDMALLALSVTLAEVANGVEYYAPDSTASVDMPRWKTHHHSILGWQTK